MLNAKQKRFCEEYLKDLNGTQAAIRAGYSVKSAAVIAVQNLIKLNIQEYIQERQRILQDKTLLDTVWVLNRFKEISDRCMTAEPIMVKNDDGQIVESGEFKFDSSGANKATEMIGKHIGFFETDNSQKKPTVIITGMSVK